MADWCILECAQGSKMEIPVLHDPVFAHGRLYAQEAFGGSMATRSFALVLTVTA